MTKVVEFKPKLTLRDDFKAEAAKGIAESPASEVDGQKPKFVGWVVIHENGSANCDFCNYSNAFSTPIGAARHLQKSVEDFMYSDDD
jgi:hypothetical protein